MKNDWAVLLGSADSVMGARIATESAMPDVALAIVHDCATDKVLLIRRAKAKHFSGWAFPGGKIEHDLPDATRRESAIAAAWRELKEETGLNVSRAGKEIFCRQHPNTKVLISYVYFSADSSLPNKNCEPRNADDCAWVALDRIDKLFATGLSDGVVRGIRQQMRKRRSSIADVAEQGMLPLNAEVF